MNTDIMIVLGLLVSKFGVSENKASECLQLVANNLFHQSLKLPNNDVIEMESSEETSEPKAKNEENWGPHRHFTFSKNYSQVD